MSSTVQPNIYAVFGPAIARPGDRQWARRICQSLALWPLFSLILLPEYVQGLGDPETKSAIYRLTVGPLRLVDLVLLACIAIHGLALASSRRLRVNVPREMVLPGLGFLAAIGLALVNGALRGGSNVFFDWRALALGIGLYGVFAIWMQSPQEVDWAVWLFAGYLALRMAWIYAEFLTGGGDLIVGVRIPVFDGPTLSSVVFTAVLTLCLSDAALRQRQILLWAGVSGAAFVLVLLCFRRTFWSELGIATPLVLLIQKQRRRRKILLASAALLAAATTLGPSFLGRLQSMDFTQDETEFSQGNPDHVGEVLDAWEQVQHHPLLGIGLGTSFQTARIREWKEESVMVHNAPLHVWLKYGLLGLACYLWFHFRVFRLLWRQRSGSYASPGTPPPRSVAAFTTAAFCYLVAQFVVSLGFTPWAYCSLQSATLIAFVLAVAMRGARSCNTLAFPSSLPR